MIGLINLARLWSARVYPALVWGTLMAMAAHAGLKMEWVRDAVESDTPTGIQENLPRSVQADLQGAVAETGRLP
jgi:hypothetical protein